MEEVKRNWREDLKIMRERFGGVTEAKKAWSKDQRNTIKAIHDALKDGPKTIPEITASTHLPGQKVVWHLMAMKRYGQAAEAGRAGDYFRYALKEVHS